MIALDFFRFWLMFLVAVFVTKWVAIKTRNTSVGPAFAFLAG